MKNKKNPVIPTMFPVIKIFLKLLKIAFRVSLSYMKRSVTLI